MVGEILPGGNGFNRPHHEKNKAIISRLEASSDEVANAVAEAYRAGCFIAGRDHGRGFVFIGVGELDAITKLEEETGEEFEVADLGIGECMALGARVGKGETITEKIRDGLRQVLEDRLSSDG